MLSSCATVPSAAFRALVVAAALIATIDAEHAERDLRRGSSLAPLAAQPSSLADAALYGQADAARRLIAAGADVNAPDDTGMTPLMIAASQGHIGIAQLLIAAKADVNAVSEDKTTALMRAASANRGDAVSLLLGPRSGLRHVDLTVPSGSEATTPKG